MKPLTSLFALVLCAALYSPAGAQAPTAAAPAPSTAAGNADPVARIKALAPERIGGPAASVRRMPFGLYEVLVDGQIYYVDRNVDYVLAGRAFDARTREDLTEKAREELLKVDFKSLPLDLAVKQVRGNGARTLVTFEDPNCGYCRKLQRDLQTLENVTIYTFLYPILSEDSMSKSRAVWCAKDRAIAWRESMAENKSLSPAGEDCKAPLDQVLALGQGLGITATPTLFFADGRRVMGAVPIARIEQKLVEVGRATGAKK